MSMTREEYVIFLKQTALSLGRQAVMKQLILKLPIFVSGPLNWIAALIVGKVLEVLIQETEFAAFFLYIDIRVTQQGKKFEEAALAWYNAPPEEKGKYEKEYLDSFYKFASLKS